MTSPETKYETALLNNDFEVRSLDAVCINESELKHPWWYNLKYLAAGLFFGFVLIKAEVMSWFRIQEMFRLQSFHMYGVIGSAIATGMLSVWLIRKLGIKTIYGEPIRFVYKKLNKGNIYGDPVRLWLGPYGCLSGSLVRPDWFGRHGGHHHPAQRHCRHLGVWLFPRKVTPLGIR